MNSQDFVRFGEMKMFMHHIYEYKKGVRDLILCTYNPQNEMFVISQTK